MGLGGRQPEVADVGLESHAAGHTTEDEAGHGAEEGGHGAEEEPTQAGSWQISIYVRRRAMDDILAQVRLDLLGPR